MSVDGLTVPTPLKVTDCEPEGAVSFMVMPPVREPEVVGVNVTSNVQLAPADRIPLNGQPANPALKLAEPPPPVM